MKVSVNILAKNGSSGPTCRAMAEGIKRCGDEVVIRGDRDFDMTGFNACVLWGFVENCQKIIRFAENKGIPWVFLDMGYWRRDESFYKVSVNDRHPTSYFMKDKLPPDRFNALRLPIKDWRKNGQGNILLAGMSGKAAWAWNMPSEQFEKDMVHAIRQHSQREIVYRPKPSWPESRPIAGAKFDRNGSLAKALQQAYCVVSHHSNVAADALLEGIPTFTKRGVSAPMGPLDLSKLESPYYPEDRQQWAYNVAYCQWRLDEMASGACWSHLKEVKLI